MDQKTLIIVMLYKIKEIYQRLFLYPQTQIDISESLDYDAYWRDKRGSSLGALSGWQRMRADIILQHIKNDVDCSVSDIGCGDGSILYYLSKYVNIKKKIGYDKSRFALNKAIENGIDGVLFDLNNQQDWQKLANTDYFLALEVLEHISEAEKVLALLYEKAKKGVFLSFPNSGYITFRLRLLFGKFPMQWRVFPNEHLRFWTDADLKWWLQALGYKDYKIYYYKGVPLLNKILPSIFAATFVVLVKK